MMKLMQLPIVNIQIYTENLKRNKLMNNIINDKNVFVVNL